MEASTLAVGAGNTTVLAGTVSYAESVPDPTGTAAATVTLAAEAPPGWTVTLDPDAAFQLAPGQEVPVTVTLVAPDAGTGEATGDLALSAQASGVAGRSASAETFVALQRVDPEIVAPTPFLQTPLGIGLVLAGLLGFLAGALLYARHRKAALAAAAAEAERLRRETGIAIERVDAPREYGRRREVMFRVVVTNRSDRPRVALVEPVDVSPGWRAATSLTRIPLSVGERVPVTLVATPEPTVAPGAPARVVVRARPEEAREMDERVQVDLEAPRPGASTR